jgi:hybrid cluster-associated redox disulfide protein
MLTPDLTVSQVLETYPQAARVFVSLKTDCVGCYLMPFCTLGEVADQYHLRVEAIMAELAKISDPWPKMGPDAAVQKDLPPGDKGAH